MRNDQAIEADERLMEERWGLDAGSGPVPAGVTAAAVTAYSWRTADAEIAGLTHDSGFRHGSGRRRLRFASPGLTVEVEVGVDEMVGRVVPPGPGNVELRGPRDRAVVSVDRRGGFTVPVPTGAFSLRCGRGSTDTQTVVVTDWVTL